jgi:hypothetical protein
MPEREHRWAIATEEIRCRGRGHLSAFTVFACWDCKACPHCAAEECRARRRPDFPPYSEAQLEVVK